jgi:hypothetical protein
MTALLIGTLTETQMNVDNAKSYATEANLMTALAKAGLDKSRPVVVRNREGRWTAVFGVALSGQNPGYIAAAGFIVIN